MKRTKKKLAVDPGPARRTGAARVAELADLRARVAEGEETLRAIRRGEVDSVMVAGRGRRGPQVFTLEGADHTYRMLIESMNEGALTLTADETILYANQCFARMVKTPLEKVTGGSFRRFLSGADRTALRAFIKRPGGSDNKIQLELNASDGSRLPVQVSVRRLEKSGPGGAITGMVVADMTDARRIEEMLRALTNRVVQVQEAERGRVVVDLHDHITQLLCAILFRCQALVVELSASGGPSMREAMNLREMLGQTAEEVERITRNLRPGVLDQLGLDAVLRATTAEFAERAGVATQISCAKLDARLPAGTELALYRILQEILRNVEVHARARNVAVTLTIKGSVLQLTIKDDGIGFDPLHQPKGKKGADGLGLLGVRERATSVGGTLTVKSTPREGTENEVRIPVPADVAAA